MQSLITAIEVHPRNAISAETHSKLGLPVVTVSRTPCYLEQNRIPLDLPLFFPVIYYGLISNSVISNTLLSQTISLPP